MNNLIKELIIKTIGDDLINYWLGTGYYKDLEDYVFCFNQEPLDRGESEILDKWINNKTTLNKLVNLFQEDIDDIEAYNGEQDWLVEDKLYRILWDYLMWYLEDKLKMENKK